MDKIPTSEDTWPQVAAKVLALCDAAAKSANEGRAPLHELVGRYEMTAHQGETFVQLFFNTALQNQFKLIRHTLTDNEAAIEATDVEGNKLFFHEYRGMGGVVLENDFYTSTGLDMDRVIDVLWQGYPGGIYLTVVQNPGEWRTKTSIHAIPPVGEAQMSTAAQSRLVNLATRHRQFLKDRVHRCYLFFGPPGTGKTTAACVLSAGFGGRILKLDAVSLPRMTVGEMGFLLETLKPSFLLVDDVDLAAMGRFIYLRGNPYSGVAACASCHAAPTWSGGLVAAETVGTEGVACLVATSDFGGSHLMRQWNSFCVEQGVHFLPVVLDRFIGTLGPLVIPGETACYECFRLRENANMDAPEIDRAPEVGAPDRQAITGFHPAMASVLGEVAALELCKFYGGGVPFRANRVIEINLLHPSMTPRRLFRLPRCPVCSPSLKTSSFYIDKDSFVPGNQLNFHEFR